MYSNRTNRIVQYPKKQLDEVQVLVLQLDRLFCSIVDVFLKHKIKYIEFFTFTNDPCRLLTAPDTDSRSLPSCGEDDDGAARRFSDLFCCLTGRLIRNSEPLSTSSESIENID